MPKFESSIGGRQFTGPALREFDIPDDSDESLHEPLPQLDPREVKEFQRKYKVQNQPTSEDLEFEREFKAAKAAKEAKRLGKERLNDGAKRRIEMLLGITRTTRQVDIDGNIFVLQTLKSKETSEAIWTASKYDGTVQSPFEIRRQLLSRSLITVADNDFNQFVGSNDLEDKLEFIDNLDEFLLNRLYDEYVLLSKEARERYAIKDVNIAQEVVDDLKK